MTSRYVPGDLKKLSRLAILRIFENVDKKVINDIEDLVEDLMNLKINEKDDDGYEGDYTRHVHNHTWLRNTEIVATIKKKY